jgi:modulator of FtsH protease
MAPSAYALTSWTTFATAEVGAAAGLTGLLFVAVSINLQRILSFAKLPARAAETLSVLLLVLLISSLTLVPQSSRLLGGETAVLAVALGAVTLTVQIRHGPDHPDDPRLWYMSRIASTQLVTGTYLIGGLSCATRWGGGLYWYVAATLFAFIGAVYNAWVLLVEIIRQNPEIHPG